MTGRLQTLAGLLPTVADALGVPGLPPALQIERPPPPMWLTGARHVIVLLVDGLGHLQLQRHAACAPTLTALVEAGPLTVPFPSTTAVSLASFGTGLPPGMHGLVGTLFRLDDGSTLAPLSWRSGPNPVATQPEPTILELLAQRGVQVDTVAPSKHRESGLTRAALRGGRYVGGDTLRGRAELVRAVVAEAKREGRASLTYVYWPELDRAGHVDGVDSLRYRGQLARVDELVADLAAVAVGDVVLAVTADHGLLDVPDARRIDIEALADLRRDVETILGEPRVRHVYCAPGRAEAVAMTWSDILGERATVLRREQAADLLGPVDEWFADRIGDVVAIANDNAALVSARIDRIVSGLRGQHGGTHPEEALVPLRVARS